MSSTQQLALGLRGSKSSLEGKWTGYHSSIRPDVWTYQNVEKPPYAQHHSICYNEDKSGWPKRNTGCRAHMKIKPVDQSNVNGDWEVVSIQLIHTCPPDGRTRKRNQKTAYLSKISSSVASYQPTATRKGNAKQLQKVAKATTGIDMKRGQAHKHIERTSHDKLEAQIGQYFWMPSMFELFEEDDPDGTYILETIPCRWNTNLKQFRRYYMCPSFSKHFWDKEEIRMMVADGTFTKGKDFKHILLLAVTFDAANRIVLLCAALVPQEDADNWVWFHGNISVDFPGFDVFMSDADKGITSNEFRASQQAVNCIPSRCARHISANCKEGCKGGTMNETNKLAIIRLAKQRTAARYHTVLQEIRHVHAGWADWLDDKKDEFATYRFLNRNRQRWGKVTSNGVENTNSAILPIRYEPIAYLTIELLYYMQQKYLSGKELAEKLQAEDKVMTDYALTANRKLGELGAKLKVQVVENNYPIYRARVEVYPNCPVTGYLEVKVNVDEYECDCPCLFVKEYSMICKHVIALLLSKGVDTLDLGWYSDRYHTTNYLECYSKPVPAFAIAGRLEIDDTMVPPEWKRSAGRPKKARTDRSNAGGRQYKCKACGGFGHQYKGCEKPSTEYRYTTIKDKAIKWCKCQTDIQVELMEDQELSVPW